MIYDLALRSVYNFSMKAGSILGYSYEQATVLGLLDFDSANVIEDVTPLHAAALSQLGTGIPRNARDLTYVKIKTLTGEIRVIAMEWIAAQPVLVTSTTVQVVITQMALSDIERLRQALISNGFTNLEITTL